MGGRLIFPFLVELAHLDTRATSYNDALREPIIERADPTDRIGRKARRERVVQAMAQVTPKSFEAIRQGINGNAPQSDIELVFHFDDLKERGLVGADGDPLININDRLVCIRDADTDDIVLAVPTPPGLYVIEAQPDGFGIGHARNLLRCQLQDREVGTDR